MRNIDVERKTVQESVDIFFEDIKKDSTKVQAVQSALKDSKDKPEFAAGVDIFNAAYKDAGIPLPGTYTNGSAYYFMALDPITCSLGFEIHDLESEHLIADFFIAITKKMREKCAG